METRIWEWYEEMCSSKKTEMRYHLFFLPWYHLRSLKFSNASCCYQAWVCHSRSWYR